MLHISNYYYEISKADLWQSKEPLFGWHIFVDVGHINIDRLGWERVFVSQPWQVTDPLRPTSMRLLPALLLLIRKRWIIKRIHHFLLQLLLHTHWNAFFDSTVCLLKWRSFSNYSWSGYHVWIVIDSKFISKWLHQIL